MPDIEARFGTDLVLKAWNAASQRRDAHGVADLSREDAVRITPRG